VPDVPGSVTAALERLRSGEAGTPVRVLPDLADVRGRARAARRASRRRATLVGVALVPALATVAVLSGVDPGRLTRGSTATGGTATRAAGERLLQAADLAGLPVHDAGPVLATDLRRLPVCGDHSTQYQSSGEAAISGGAARALAVGPVYGTRWRLREAVAPDDVPGLGALMVRKLAACPAAAGVYRYEDYPAGAHAGTVVAVEGPTVVVGYRTVDASLVRLDAISAVGDTLVLLTAEPLAEDAPSLPRPDPLTTTRWFAGVAAAAVARATGTRPAVPALRAGAYPAAPTTAPTGLPTPADLDAADSPGVWRLVPPEIGARTASASGAVALPSACSPAEENSPAEEKRDEVPGRGAAGTYGARSRAGARLVDVVALRLDAAGAARARAALQAGARCTAPTTVAGALTLELSRGKVHTLWAVRGDLLVYLRDTGPAAPDVEYDWPRTWLQNLVGPALDRAAALP